MLIMTCRCTAQHENLLLIHSLSRQGEIIYDCTAQKYCHKFPDTGIWKITLLSGIARILIVKGVE